MSTTTNQYLQGLDLLKFVLAILIVSGHCQLFMEFPPLHKWWGHITSIAVPIFFGISSYLFFRKVYSFPKETETRPFLSHSVKRLIILFVCWYVLMIPMTYFQFFSVATVKETIFAFLLSCSLRGYWFIKALIINTIIIYFFRKTKALIICTIISLVIYLYCAFNYIYHFNPTLENIHPYYSFYYHTIAFCIGALLAKFKFRTFSANLLLLLWLFALLLCHFEWMDPFFRIISVCLILPFFIRLNILTISTKRLISMRNMSTILYMVQFLLIWLYDGGCNLFKDTSSELFHFSQFSIVRFVVVLFIAISIALLILKGESRYKWLKYLH